MHSDIEHTDFPNVIVVIVRDDLAETYCMLYCDSRGISRTYEMSLSNMAGDVETIPGLLAELHGYVRQLQQHNRWPVGEVDQWLGLGA
jgi:hypothetical protein